MRTSSGEYNRALYGTEHESEWTFDRDIIWKEHGWINLLGQTHLPSNGVQYLSIQELQNCWRVLTVLLAVCYSTVCQVTKYLDAVGPPFHICECTWSPKLPLSAKCSAGYCKWQLHFFTRRPTSTLTLEYCLTLPVSVCRRLIEHNFIWKHEVETCTVCTRGSSTV